MSFIIYFIVMLFLQKMFKDIVYKCGLREIEKNTKNSIYTTRHISSFFYRVLWYKDDTDTEFLAQKNYRNIVQIGFKYNYHVRKL